MFGKKRPDDKQKDKLKIIFICSSLEPGRDGVGDYTRRIAIELIRQGHSASVLSLNEKYISEEFRGVQHEGENYINVLRIPATLPLKKRFNLAKQYVDELNPDWLSLQFVIFGYQRKGLPFLLGSRLALLGLGKKWHIMFHELWLGMEKGTSIKNLMWGNTQRLLIKSLISKIRPKVIHSHTVLYQHHLLKLGFDSQYLPLFGNIPKMDNSVDNPKLTPGSPLNFVLFGHIFPGVPIVDFTNDVYNYAVKSGINASLTIIGRCGKEQEKWVAEWESLGLTVNVLGEQPIKVISEVLGSATFGISTTPAALIGKSGSVAAMHEYGLPVICVPFLWEPRKFNDVKIPDGVILYKKGNLETIFLSKIQPPMSKNVTLIGTQFVNSLLT